MKRNTRIFTAILILAFAGMLEAGVGFGVRPLIMIGKTLNAPTLDELDYGSLLNRPQDLNTLSYGGSIQFMFKIGAFRAGLDVGIQSLFISEVSTSSDSVDYEKNIEFAGHTLGLIELNPLRLLIFQAGFGVYGVRWAYFSSDDGIDVEDIHDIDLNFGVMLAGGINIPMGRHFSIPIMLRADLIFRHGITAPITLVAGLSFNL